MAAVSFMFTACNKCKECSHNDYEYITFNENTGNEENYGDRIEEVSIQILEVMIQPKGV